MPRVLSILVALLMAMPIIAQSPDPSPIIFIVDASGSMWGQMDGKTKIEIARNVLSESVDKLPEGQKVGLVAYGHRSKADCEDVEFLVDVEEGEKAAVTKSLGAIKPIGKTPLAYSAQMVIDNLKMSGIKATIILITDGIESCGGDICQVVKAAKEAGVEFKLHIIGFGLSEGETEQLNCAATAGGGHYYDAAGSNQLGDVLVATTEATVDDPPGNISIYAIKNGEAIDAWVRAYDTKTKQNPIVGRTYGDTAYIYLPPGTYDLEVNALGGSDVKPITLKNVASLEDEIVHRTVSIDGGKFRVMTSNNGEGWDAVVKVLDDEGKSIAVTRTYGRTQDIEVDPGGYDISFAAMRMKGLESTVVIKNKELIAGGVTEISHDFKTGEVFVDAKADGKSIDSIVKFKETTSGKSITSRRSYSKGADFLLNPGTYEVTVQPLKEYKDRPVQTFNLEVKTGEKISKEVNF